MTAKTSDAKAQAKKTKSAKSNTNKATARAARKPATRVKPVRKQEVPAKKTDTKHVLRLWNIRLGVVLLALAVAVIVAGDSSTVPVTTQYLTGDTLATEAAGGVEVLSPATRHIADVHVSWLVAKFVIIAAGMYLLAATVWRKRYEAWLDRGVNKLRWAGFGLAGGAAVASVAMLSGVSDIATLALIFGSVVLAGAFAATLELLGPGRRLSRLLAFGAVAGLLLPWIGFVTNMIGALAYGSGLPLRLYLLYAAVTLWFVVIALAVHYRITQRGRWADAVYAEKAFMLLGFSAIAVLALQIFTGILQS